jgi:hypothetical protein
LEKGKKLTEALVRGVLKEIEDLRRNAIPERQPKQ